MYSEKEFKSKFKAIPKAELHIHSEAVISKNTAYKFLVRSGEKDINRDNMFVFNNLKEFIDTFIKLQNSYKDLDDFKTLFDDIKDYLVKNNIIYTEMFFSPSSFKMLGFEISDMFDVISDKIKEIEESTNIIIKIIVDVSRTFGVENSFHNYDEAIKYMKKSDVIVGIGLGGNEALGPAHEFKGVFDRANKDGINKVAHAGESVGPESVWSALKDLGAVRIGHGISSIEDTDLIMYLKENKIPLEICPTSNVFTRHYVDKIENHPVRDFYEYGIPIILNTDDPAFFDVELLDEYWNLYSKLNFSLDELKTILKNGFIYSFLSDDKKAYYLKQVDEAWSKQFN